ncbi:hypothetical protein FHS11_002690 [Mucilaginibacter gotjawali]|uniref:Uncharacterized protein n=1 Tax=Mucilaginibacter gotjawali TaxID=1550579 RepID=A0A839SIC1_9SPHI|nr:hypothetical protein [Mucilaginibacter gotjawali]
MSFLSTIKSTARLKKEPHWLIIPPCPAWPKIMVNLVVDRYFLKKGKITEMPLKTYWTIPYLSICNPEAGTKHNAIFKKTS